MYFIRTLLILLFIDCVLTIPLSAASDNIENQSITDTEAGFIINLPDKAWHWESEESSDSEKHLKIYYFEDTRVLSMITLMIDKRYNRQFDKQKAEEFINGFCEGFFKDDLATAAVKNISIVEGNVPIQHSYRAAIIAELPDSRILNYFFYFCSTKDKLYSFSTARLGTRHVMPDYFIELVTSFHLMKKKDILPEQDIWYIKIAGKEYGPCTLEEIKSGYLQGSFSFNTLVHKSGQSEWRRIRDIPEIFLR